MQQHKTEIENLYFHYAYAIDAGDFSAAANLFRNATLLDATGRDLASGAKQIEQFYQQVIKIDSQTKTPKTQHVISNILILDQSANELSATANYTVFQKAKSENIEAIICGQYLSTFKRAQAKWEFHTHQTKPLTVGDMSNHLKLDIRNIANRHNKPSDKN